VPSTTGSTARQLDLADRQALRRVAGLSTELQDVTEVEYASCAWSGRPDRRVDRRDSAGTPRTRWPSWPPSRETAGSMVLDGLIQRRDSPDPATYVGSGKAGAARHRGRAGADTVDLRRRADPGQLRQLEAVVKVKVIDRTALILDIFAQHAKSREGKAQVSLAQMQYMLPRLRGWGESMSRQAGGAGGSGGRGVGTAVPGETKIETDRRRIRTKIGQAAPARSPA
jgi:GTP-binding protein HflX